MSWICSRELENVLRLVILTRLGVTQNSKTGFGGVVVRVLAFNL